MITPVRHCAECEGPFRSNRETRKLCNVCLNNRIVEVCRTRWVKAQGRRDAAARAQSKLQQRIEKARNRA